MTRTTTEPGAVSRHLNDVLGEATGRRRHDNPVAPRTGGPAGNVRLTAWLGAALFVLLAAEAVTLLDVRGFVSWHIGFGIVLVALTLTKTASTSWRMVRYYTGAAPYRHAGPPPLVLRALGPVLVVSALGVLGTGLALIALGRANDHVALLSVLGQRIDPVTLHQAFFVVFAAAIGLHVLGRIAPALQQLTTRTAVPGAAMRAVVVVAVLAAGTAAAVIIAPGAWA